MLTNLPRDKSPRFLCRSYYLLAVALDESQNHSVFSCKCALNLLPAFSQVVANMSPNQMQGRQNFTRNSRVGE